MSAASAGPPLSPTSFSITILILHIDKMFTAPDVLLLERPRGRRPLEGSLPVLRTGEALTSLDVRGRLIGITVVLTL